MLFTASDFLRSLSSYRSVRVKDLLLWICKAQRVTLDMVQRKHKVCSTREEFWKSARSLPKSPPSLYFQHVWNVLSLDWAPADTVCQSSEAENARRAEEVRETQWQGWRYSRLSGITISAEPSWMTQTSDSILPNGSPQEAVTRPWSVSFAWRFFIKVRGVRRWVKPGKIQEWTDRISTAAQGKHWTF